MECFAENNCIQANPCLQGKKNVCRKWLKEEKKRRRVYRNETDLDV